MNRRTNVRFWVGAMIGCVVLCFLAGVSRANPSSDGVGQDEKVGRDDNIALLQRQASEAFVAGRYKEAFEKSGKICTLDPGRIDHWLFRGETSFAAGEMKACVAAYDESIRLRPTIEPQLWQRGLALYYAGEFEDGVKQFETHQTVNSQDVENAVWHLLCAARISDVDKARKKLIPIEGDTRIPMSQIYEMFAGRMDPESVLEVAQKGSRGGEVRDGRNALQLYYAHLYIGLYHEMLKQNEQATVSLKKAAKINPLGNTNFMGQVARVHLSLARQRSKVETINSETKKGDIKLKTGK